MFFAYQLFLNKNLNMAKGSRVAEVAERTLDINERKLSDPASRSSDINSPTDSLNQSIISMLQEDGRMAFSEIAQSLNVSEGTIRNRVNGMKQAGMLRIVAVVDPTVAEYTTDAIIGIKVASGTKPQDVARRLAAMPEIIYIVRVGGRYDLIVEVVSADHDDFLKFLDDEIHGKADIASSETMPGLQNFKNQFLLRDD